MSSNYFSNVWPNIYTMKTLLEKLLLNSIEVKSTHLHRTDSKFMWTFCLSLKLIKKLTVGHSPFLNKILTLFISDHSSLIIFGHFKFNSSSKLNLFTFSNVALPCLVYNQINLKKRCPFTISNNTHGYYIPIHICIFNWKIIFLPRYVHFGGKLFPSHANN